MSLGLFWINTASLNKSLWCIFGWIVVRPLRVLSRQCAMGSFGGLRLLPERTEYGGCPDLPQWRMPNAHQWLLYRTAGKFFIWLRWNGWRPFCRWGKHGRESFPFVARVLYKIGQTMSYGFYGGECYHCASDIGDPVDLADTDEHFELLNIWTIGTENGTDHRFRGITTCPRCGFRREYEDGSL